MQYQIALQTSKDRLKLFNEQLNNQYETKHDISLLLIEHDKRIDQLKKLLSNLGVHLIVFYIKLLIIYTSLILIVFNYNVGIFKY